MATRWLVVLVLVGLFAFPCVAPAQSYGDGFGVGGLLLPSSSAGTIVGKTRLGESLGLEVSFGLNSYSSDGSSSTSFTLGVGALVHMNTTGQFQPYWGGRASIANSSGSGTGGFEWDWRQQREDRNGDSSSTTFGLTGVFGAEYFITKKLSLEGEIGLGMYFGSFSIASETRFGGFIYL